MGILKQRYINAVTRAKIEIAELEKEWDKLDHTGLAERQHEILTRIEGRMEDVKLFQEMIGRLEELEPDWAKAIEQIVLTEPQSALIELMTQRPRYTTEELAEEYGKLNLPRNPETSIAMSMGATLSSVTRKFRAITKSSFYNHYHTSRYEGTTRYKTKVYMVDSAFLDAWRNKK